MLLTKTTKYRTISCIISAVLSQLPHASLLLQLFQSNQIKLHIKLVKKFKKILKKTKFFHFCKEIYDEDIFDKF